MISEDASFNREYTQEKNLSSKVAGIQPLTQKMSGNESLPSVFKRLSRINREKNYHKWVS